uniref:Uncharacterized protein n=1 Tax=Arundo donax TaxID=35708 RepID=A0A0A9E6W2_ARUDO
MHIDTELNPATNNRRKIQNNTRTTKCLLKCQQQQQNDLNYT